MDDFSDFFTPASFGAWNPPNQSLFPMSGAGSNGVPATPSGMLGSNFGGAPPAMPGVAATNPAMLPGSTNGIPATGRPTPSVMPGPSVGTALGTPGATPGATPDAGQSWLSKINTSRLTPAFFQNLQKMLGPKPAPQGQFQPIQMAQPVGPGRVQPPASPVPGLLSPFLPPGGGQAGIM